MARIKFMGTADVRVLRAGDSLGGRLATPLARDIVWDKHNKFIVDTSELGLSEDVAKLLLTDSEFLDVTDLEVVPLSEGDKMFRGLSDEPHTGTLPPGYVKVASIPTSRDNVATPEAEAFAQAVTGTPADPVVTGTGVKAPAKSVPSSTPPTS